MVVSCPFRLPKLPTRYPGDIKAARGTMLVLETLVAGWQGDTAIPADWHGTSGSAANPPQYMVELLRQASGRRFTPLVA